METDNGTQKYDLIFDNYKAIQGLVMARARQLVREQGATLGRGIMQAEDEIAARLIVEHVTGQELSRWLADQRAILRHPPEEYIPPAPAIKRAREFEARIETPGLHVNQPIQDEDTFRVSGLVTKHRTADPVLMDLAAKCKRIQVGEVWSFPTASLAESEALAKYLPKVSKLLGWRQTFKKKSYQHQSFPDRLKLKRIS